VPDSCVDKVVGTPQWSGVDSSLVLIDLPNPYLKNLKAGAASESVLAYYLTHCTVCSVHENALDGADAQAECIPES